MADPISWALIAANVASKVVSAGQEYAQAKHEANVAGVNAQIAEQNAARARLEAGIAEEAKRRDNRKALGRAAAAASQSGIGAPGEGSAGLVIGQSAREAELDALNIRYSGDIDARANLEQAEMFRAERKAAQQRAKGAVVSGVFGAATAGLSGYSNYFGPSTSTAAPLRKPKAPMQTRPSYKMGR